MFYQCKQKSCRKRQCQYKNTLLINVLIALCCWFGWMMDGHFRQAGLFGIALSEVPCVKHALVWPVPPGNPSVFRWFQARACAGVRAALLLGRYPHVRLVPMPVRASGFLACLLVVLAAGADAGLVTPAVCRCAASVMKYRESGISDCREGLGARLADRSGRRPGRCYRPGAVREFFAWGVLTGNRCLSNIRALPNGGNTAN